MSSHETQGQQWSRGNYEISTDPARLEIDTIHRFLAGSYWAAGIPLEVVERSIANSLSFGIFAGSIQVGFARVITDYATLAYLADVFVLDEHRGKGLSKWLIEVVVTHPKLQGLRRWMLATRDAHGLYRQVGFEVVAQPDRWMERHDPDVYKTLVDASGSTRKS
jgi:GNAT superfamily N-acetyltransferase